MYRLKLIIYFENNDFKKILIDTNKLIRRRSNGGLRVKHLIEIGNLKFINLVTYYNIVK